MMGFTDPLWVLWIFVGFSYEGFEGLGEYGSKSFGYLCLRRRFTPGANYHLTRGHCLGAYLSFFVFFFF